MMRLNQEYYNNLLAFALSSKEWTAIAQAELFRHITMKDRIKMNRFLEAVRGSEKLRGFSRAVTSLNLGNYAHGYKVEGLGDDLGEIAFYCPNLVDVSCWNVDVRLEYFRASFHLSRLERHGSQFNLLAGNMKKLEKLKITHGSFLPNSTSGASPQTITLPITLLSLYDVRIPSPIDPSSLPPLRSLHLEHQTCQPIRLLLSQLASLQVAFGSVAELGILIQQSTSITSLSIREGAIVELDDASKTVIKEKIVEFRSQVSKYGASSDSALTTIIDGSKVMKKVILDGIHLSVADQVKPKFLATLKVVKEACKKKKIESWKENFDVGNGKVDLEK
jgi:hypothetical protein